MRIIAETMFSAQLAEDVRLISESLTLLLADLDFRFQVPFYPRIGFPTLRNLRAPEGAARGGCGHLSHHSREATKWSAAE